MSRRIAAIVPALCVLFCLPGRVLPSPVDADSVEIVDQLTSQGYADEAEAAAIVSEIRYSASANGYSREGPGARLRIERSMGYRESLRLAGRVGRAGYTGSFELSNDRGRYGSFARFATGGDGLVVLAGGVRPRLGENLLLGASYTPFSAMNTRRGVPGLSASRTASVWNRTRGALVSCGRHGARLSALVWRDGGCRETGWVSAGRRSERFSAGLAAGATRASESKPATFAGGSAVVCAGTSHTGVSAELAVIDRMVYAAVRLLMRSKGVWEFRLYKSPRPSTGTGGVVLPGDETRRRLGGAVYRQGQLGGLETRVSLTGLSRRELDRRELCKRFDLSVRGNTGAGGGWYASLRLSENRELEYPPGTIEHLPELSRDRELVLRSGWTGGGSSVFRQRYRISLKVEGDGSVGVVSVIGWNVVYGCMDAGFQASDYSMSSGQTGFVLRPGFSGADAVAAVTRSGSDLSARIRLSLNRFRMLVSASRPWRARVRWYVNVGFSV